MSDNLVQITLRQQKDYQFNVDFGGGIAILAADEPAPLGSGLGPSPVQLLAAAVGNCLSDSLLFALRKFKQAPESLQHLDRVLDQFEAFCTVTQSVGQGIAIELQVVDAAGVRLK